MTGAGYACISILIAINKPRIYAIMGYSWLENRN